MTDAVILAIDQGTTSSRAILFSKRGEILATRQKELKIHTPHPGWVEQDPKDIWNDTLWACRIALEDAGADADKLAAVGIANQRETTIIWDRETGKPVYNAIVWQDRRTADMCDRLKKEGAEDNVAARTGLLLYPYFSATKIAWILDNIEGARERAEAGKLAFGTVDSFLLWRLSNGRVHATDTTNAARTMLFNLQQNAWDQQMLDLFDIPRSLLPEVRENAADYASLGPDMLGREVRVTGMAGDQQAAMVGQACFQPGMIKSTYGTGCFALMNIGDTFRRSQNRLLTTPAYRLGGRTTYAIEGSIFIAGAAIQWLRDNLGLIRDASESEGTANSVADTNGVYFVPALTGLGAPHWQAQASGILTGLGRDSRAAHIVRAALEAQAYQTYDLMQAMADDSGYTPAMIRADGGLVANDFMCGFLADILQVPVEVPEVHETTALGAAYLAGLQAGVYNGLDSISDLWKRQKAFQPNMDESRRARLLNGWNTALCQCLAGVEGH